MQILWVVSPPHFAESLRERAASLSLPAQPPTGASELAQKHGLRDARGYFVPRLAMVATMLGTTALLLGLVNRAQPLRVALIYTLGTVLATVATVAAIGPGQLSPIVFPVAAVFVCIAVFVGAVTGAWIGTFTRRASQ
jgi:hypothetical protein